jgi:hypothetical protein
MLREDQKCKSGYGVVAYKMFELDFLDIFGLPSA